jgi:hypothetical protein
MIGTFFKKLQFCNQKHFNQNSCEKVMITQSFEHICSPKTWLLSKANQLLVPRLALGNNHVPEKWT